MFFSKGCECVCLCGSVCLSISVRCASIKRCCFKRIYETKMNSLYFSLLLQCLLLYCTVF